VSVPVPQFFRLLRLMVSPCCLCIPLIVARQRTVYLSVRISSPLKCFVFYAVRVVSEESRRLVVHRTSTFPSTILRLTFVFLVALS
jgi:hypothetical protein